MRLRQNVDVGGSRGPQLAFTDQEVEDIRAKLVEVTVIPLPSLNTVDWPVGLDRRLKRNLNKPFPPSSQIECTLIRLLFSERVVFTGPALVTIEVQGNCLRDGRKTMEPSIQHTIK